MQIKQLWLGDYRNYVAAEVEFVSEGLTIIRGNNGAGKTNLLEAIGYCATLKSLRGAPADALVRYGCASAIVRAQVCQAGREVLIEAQISPGARDRVQVNRQVLRRARDLVGTFGVSVFSPEDLSLVKSGPSERRRYLDDTLVSLQPGVDRLCSDLDRVLRQRNALLKQAGGRATPEVTATLDVWDAQLSQYGTLLAKKRFQLVERLNQPVAEAYAGLAMGRGDRKWLGELKLTYRYSWEGLLATALASKRKEDLRRGVTTVGPQRDELDIVLGSPALPARTHASQGEQRCLALALRLAAHCLVIAETGETPVLLLDDVFSELDPDRSAALLNLLPAGQSLLSTAGPLPVGIEPTAVLAVRSGSICRESLEK
ncbi:MAG: DNA replication/repair protein RecF [Acidimicrobiales bacterium]